MQPLWLRYLRLWGIALEARLELALSRWTARILRVMLMLLAGGMVLILLTAAAITWTAGSSAWGRGFLVGAGIWMGLLVILIVPGRLWLNKVLFPKDAAYRLRLAQSGMRIIEKTQQPSPTQAFLPTLYPLIGRFIWQVFRRWLRKWIPFL